MRNRFVGAFLTALTIVNVACSAEGPKPIQPPAREVSASTIVDGDDFFRQIAGYYPIASFGPLGGTQKPAEGYVGAVEVEDDTVYLAFPYCPDGGGCLPGYAELPTKKVQVVKTDDLYAVTLGKERYTWRVLADGNFEFVNYQLVLSGGEVKSILFMLHPPEK